MQLQRYPKLQRFLGTVQDPMKLLITALCLTFARSVEVDGPSGESLHVSIDVIVICIYVYVIYVEFIYILIDFVDLFVFLCFHYMHLLLFMFLDVLSGLNSVASPTKYH